MLRLMIVDDEQIIREALSSMIDYTSLGYKVIATAKNGMEAYDRIRDDYPDVVITDIKMPILNGLELIERASHIDSRITFILLSQAGHEIRGPLLSLKTHGQAGADQLSEYNP